MRRYAPIRQGTGTQTPSLLRARVLARDGGCVGLRVGMPGLCSGGVEIDHVRASHAMGMKSETEEWNLASLCGWHHKWKTEHGREGRALLLPYLARVSPAPSAERRSA